MIEIGERNYFNINFLSLPSPPPNEQRRIEPPTEDELDKFYKVLNSSADKPAISKITPPYSKQFIPAIPQASFPPLSQLYEPDALKMEYLELLHLYYVKLHFKL